MIPNYWYAIDMSRNIGRKPRTITRFGQPLVLWRDTSGKIQCLEDRCLHRRTRLSLGRIVGDEIKCRFHGFQYSGTGQCTLIPANGKHSKISSNLCIQAFPIREQRGLVHLWYGDKSKVETQLPWFSELNHCSLPYIEMAIDIPTSFCRTMESNMDFSHFYHLHQNYFTAQSKLTYAKGFTSSVEGDRIDISGKFCEDTEEAHHDDSGVEIKGSVLFPAMALYDSPLDPGMNPVVIMHSPIDETSTWFYSRHYLQPGFGLSFRKFFKKWIILKLFWKHYVYKQDLSAWLNQSPRDSGLGSDVLPSSCDIGIVQYLKLWEKALKPKNLSKRPDVPQERAADATAH